MLPVFASIILISGYVLFILLKRRPLNKKGKIISPIEELLRSPENVEVNLKTIHTPSISGYALKVLNYFYYTHLGRFFFSRFMLSRSNLDIFANVVIPEPPTLLFSPIAENCSDCGDSANVLASLVESTRGNKLFNCVSDFHVAYRSGKTTPIKVANVVLNAIEDSNKREAPLRAIVAYNRAAVLAMAKASTERWSNGSQLSLLDGVPISVKEDFRTDFFPGFCGTTFLPEIVKVLPESSIVRRLCDIGAIIIGVTNMPEFGTNPIGCSENLTHMQPRNPYNPDFFPGGSSSGCAVSVAAGLCPISLAGDGGGSGRVPAAVCGAVALKPTNGRFNEPGSFLSLFSFSSVSPISCSSLDIAIFFDALCNSDERSISSTPINLNGLGNLEPNLAGVTFGVCSGWTNRADKETVVVFEEAVRKIKLLGAVVKEIQIPELEEIRVAHVITAVSELFATMSVDIDRNFPRLGPGPLISAAAGRSFSATEYLNAMKQRTRAITALKLLFQQVDAIITPTVGCPVPRITKEYFGYGKIDGRVIGDMELFTYYANFTGAPAITLPIGTLNEELGLPVGLQIIGPWFQEAQLMKYALQMEASGCFPQLKPRVWYDVLPNKD